MKIQQIVDDIKNDTLSIPPFQRGFVWPPKFIEFLMDSLYRGYPIGVITTWKQAGNTDKSIDMVVDGQQRTASIYACCTDKPPPTYTDADKKPRTGIYFHILKEQFKFTTPKDRNEDKMWIKVSELYGTPAEPKTRAWRTQIKNSPNYVEEDQDLYDERINQIKGIKDRDISFDQIESTRNVDEVVEMFDRINSKATPLKREDLEIARMSTKWTEAKNKIIEERDKWANTLLQGTMREAAIIRSMHAVHEAAYDKEGLKTATAQNLRDALKATSHCNRTMLQLLQEQLGMYDQKAIKAVIAFPALARFLYQQGTFKTENEKANALAYVLISNAWNIYRSGTDTAIDADIKALQKDNPWEQLNKLIMARLGELKVNPHMFKMTRTSPSRGYTLYHALYMRREVCDWHTLNTLRSYQPHELEQHHIFPKIHLQTKYPQDNKMVEDIANIAVITGETNRRLTDRPPETYLKEIDDKNSHTLQTHCITRDRALWTIDQYPAFLDSRRLLLAKAAQNMLDNLIAGRLPSRA